MTVVTRGDSDVYSKVKEVSSDPATGTEGDAIINTTTNEYKVYYDGSWQTIYTFTVDYLLKESGDYLLKESEDKIEIN